MLNIHYRLNLTQNVLVTMQKLVHEFLTKRQTQMLMWEIHRHRINRTKIIRNNMLIQLEHPIVNSIKIILIKLDPLRINILKFQQMQIITFNTMELVKQSIHLVIF